MSNPVPVSDTYLDAAEYDPLEDADLLEEIVRALVTDPRHVQVEERRNQRGCHILHVKVAPSDVGKVIGKNGRMAIALRTVMHAIGTRNGYPLLLEVEDPSHADRSLKSHKVLKPRQAVSTLRERF